MHRTAVFMKQYIPIIIRKQPRVMLYIQKRKARSSNNAEQDNVYDIVHSYIYTDFYFFIFFAVLNLVIVHSRTMLMM